MKFSLVLCFTGAESGGSLKHAIRVRSDGAAINTTTRAPTTTGPGNGCRTDQLSLKNYVFFIIVISAYMYVPLWITTSLYFIWSLVHLISKAKLQCIHCLCNKRLSHWFNILFCICFKLELQLMMFIRLSTNSNLHANAFKS